MLRGFLASTLEAGGMLWFPVVQDCPDGAAERWIEIPAAGQDPNSLEMPAPGLTLIEKAGGH